MTVTFGSRWLGTSPSRMYVIQGFSLRGYLQPIEKLLMDSERR